MGDYRHEMHLNDLRVRTRLEAAYWGLTYDEYHDQLREMGVAGGMELRRLTRAEMEDA